MLEKFRNKNVTSFVYGTLVVALVGGLVITWGPGSRTGSMTGIFAEDCVVKVSGQCVPPRQMKAAYALLKPQEQNNTSPEEALVQMMGLGHLAPDTDPKKREEVVAKADARFRKLITEGLVDREMLATAAERQGLAVNEEELLDSVMSGVVAVSIPLNDPVGGRGGGEVRRQIGSFVNAKTKNFDKKAFEREAKRWSGSAEAFEAWQRRELLASKMRRLVMAPVRVSEQEGFDAYVAEKSNATLETVNVKESYVARYLPDLTDAEVEAWAKEGDHQKEIDAKAEAQKTDDADTALRVRHILVKIVPSATPAERTAAEQKLARAWARLKSGAAFASVAREFSEDGNASKGGWYEEKDLANFVTEFKDAANGLKAGQVTDGAVETAFGWHIIAKDDPSKSAGTLAKAKKDIARRLATKARVEAKTKEIAAAIQAGLIAKKPVDEVIDAAIASLPATPKKYALAKVKAMPVKADEKKPEDKKAEKADDKKSDAKKAIEKLVEITSKSDPEKPQLMPSAAFNKDGDPIPNVNSDVQRAVAKFAFSAAEGTVYETLVRGEERSAAAFSMHQAAADDPGFIVVRLKEHKLATKEEFTKERDLYMQALLAAKQGEALNLYMKDLREKSKDDVKYIAKYATAATAGPEESGE